MNKLKGMVKPIPPIPRDFRMAAMAGSYPYFKGEDTTTISFFARALRSKASLFLYFEKGETLLTRTYIGRLHC